MWQWHSRQRYLLVVCYKVNGNGIDMIYNSLDLLLWLWPWIGTCRIANKILNQRQTRVLRQTRQFKGKQCTQVFYFHLGNWQYSSYSVISYLQKLVPMVKVSPSTLKKSSRLKVNWQSHHVYELYIGRLGSHCWGMLHNDFEFEGKRKRLVFLKLLLLNKDRQPAHRHRTKCRTGHR